MEARMNLRSLARYLNQSPDYIRFELMSELRQRLQGLKRVCACAGDSSDVAGASGCGLRKAMVRDPRTPAPVLEMLASADEVEILIRVAEHCNSSSHILACLGQSEHVEVRMAVAENLNTPTYILNQLVGDESMDVRFRLAECPHVPEAVLLALLDDDCPYIAVRAERTLAAKRKEVPGGRAA